MSHSSNSTVAPRTSITPMLSVRNGAKAIEFYKAAFGADERFRLNDESGAAIAQLSVGAAEFWLADEITGKPEFQPRVGWRWHSADGNGGGRPGCRV